MPLDERSHAGVRSLAERLGKDFAAVLSGRAEAPISTLNTFDEDLSWQPWDAVYELERQQRTEWILQDLTEETEEQALREMHGDPLRGMAGEERPELVELLRR